MITLDDLDPLVPTPAAQPKLAAHWGTITQSKPLRVSLDGPGGPLPYTPISLTPGLSVGARVLCLLIDRQLVVLGGTMGGLPPGTIAAYAGTSVPPGWLWARGHAVSRAAFPGLFEAIKTTYGEGDGVTSFRLPDLRGRVLVGLDPTQPAFASLGQIGGETDHTLSVAETAKHSHGVNGGWGAGPGNDGAWRIDENSPGTFWGPTAESGGGQPHNNLQPYLTCIYIIKI